MTEEILTAVVFAVPVLVVGIIKQRKRELEHKKRVLVLLRETEQLNQFKHGVAYEEIKDRNGRMVNGTYVKSDDL